MAMRRQVYNWSHRPDGFLGVPFAAGGARAANNAQSIFTGPFGSSVTVPATTSATQFVVIEHLGSSPGTSGPTAPGAVDPLAKPGNVPVQSMVRVDDGYTPPADANILGADGAGDFVISTNFPYVTGTLEIFGYAPAGAVVPYNAGFTRLGAIQAGAAAVGTEVREIVTVVGGPMAGLTTGPSTLAAFPGGGIGGTFHVAFTTVMGGGAGEAFYIAYMAETRQVQSNGSVQVRLNTTNYYQTPDGVPDANGLPGDASPYPASTRTQQMYFLSPDIYVLPGQLWDLVYTTGNGVGADPQTAALQTDVFCRYMLYDGPDSLIANTLLELGITVTPDNVDWWKRMVMDSQGVPQAESQD